MEGKNLFENVHFGDKFLTRNNRIVLFINSDGKRALMIDQKGCKYFVNLNGNRYEDTEDDMDIVCKIANKVTVTPEEIDEECERIYHKKGFDEPEQVFCLDINCNYTDFRWGFNEGYDAAWKKLTGQELICGKEYDKEDN